MEKTITVSELVKKYESAVDKMKPNVLKGIKSEKYMNYEYKIAKMNNIVVSTHTNKDANVYVNTPMKFVLFSLSIIDMYTNIEIDFENILNEFNALHSVGLIDKLIHPTQEQEVIIPTNEVSECAEIMSMIAEDFMVNNYGMNAMLNKFLISVKEMLPTILSEYVADADKSSVENE